MPITMLANLPKFSKIRNEDPATHVERFEEVFITSLVTDPNYYLVWFPPPWMVPHMPGIGCIMLQLSLHGKNSKQLS